MVARCEHSAQESPGNSFSHIVDNDQVKQKINPSIQADLQVGGHLEIQDGRHIDFFYSTVY